MSQITHTQPIARCVAVALPPINYQSATIFATSSIIRSVAQSVCISISLSYVSYHGKSCAVHVVVAHAVYLSRALEMSIHLTLTLSVALILSRALSTRTQICLSMTHRLRLPLTLVLALCRSIVIHYLSGGRATSGAQSAVACAQRYCTSETSQGTPVDC